MKRLVISMSIALLLAPFGLVRTFAGARGQPARALHDAVLSGDIGLVRSVISGGTDVNAKDEAGFTPLFHAAGKGQTEIAKVLITGGANVNATDQYGNTPLHFAAVQGHYAACELLLAKGADPGAQNLTGGTALAMAKAGGHNQVVQVLSGRGTRGGTFARPADASGVLQSKASGTDYLAELNKLGIAGRPESDNAAPYYQRALQLHVEMPEELQKVSSATWPADLSAKEQLLLKGWVQSNTEALSQLELGAIKPYHWRKRSSPDGSLMKMQMPGLSTFRQLCSVIGWRAKLAAAEGKMDKAAADIVTCYRLGLHVGVRGPKFLIEQLVGIAIRTKALQTAFDILDRTKVDTTEMKSLQSQIEQLSTNESYIPGLRAEKFMLLDVIQRIFTDDGKGDGRIDMESVKAMLPEQGLQSLQVQVQSLQKLQRRQTIEAVEKAFEYSDFLIQKSPWQWKNENINPDQEIERITQGNALVHNLVPALPRVAQIFARCKADTDALITTLALLRYKADQGGLPEKADNLVSGGYLKAVPTDPFSDNALVYKQRGNDFMLYSFGEDCDDDGGQVGRSSTGKIRKWADAGDAVFWPVEGPATASAQTTRQQVMARTGYSYARSAPTERPVSRPADPRRRTNSAATRELHMAVLSGRLNRVESAIANGADINGKDRQSLTPLHVAVLYRQKEIAELLVAQGADVNAKDNRGYTPLHLVAMKGVSDVMDTILAKGADVNATDQTGQTPLCLAAQYGHKDVVELLIAKGADVNAQTRDQNALSLARKNRRNDIVELLLKHGAKEPVVTAMGDRLYGGQEGLEGSNLYAGPQQQARLQTGAVMESTTQVNIANILADPNEIKARIRTFEGLDKVIAQVDRRSRLEIGEWLQRKVDNRVKLAKAVELQIKAEVTCVRKVAVEEKAEKTTAAIDGLLADRQTRFRTLVKAMEEELKAQRPTRGRGSRGGRYGGRSSGARTRYPQDGRAGGGMYAGQAEGRGGYVGAGTGAMGMGRTPAGYGGAGAKEIPVSEWMQGPDSRTNLARSVQDQVKAELTPIRKVAVEEEADKTTAAIDGVLLSRQVRLDQLLVKMGGGPGGLPGRYPGVGASTTEPGQYPLRPRRR